MSSLPITSRCPLALNWLTENRWRVQDVQHGASGRQQAVTAGADNAALEGVEDDVLVDTRALGGKQNSDVAALMARRGNTPTSDQGACCASARILAHTCCCDVSVHYKVLLAHQADRSHTICCRGPAEPAVGAEQVGLPASGRTHSAQLPRRAITGGGCGGRITGQLRPRGRAEGGSPCASISNDVGSSSGCTRLCRAVSAHAWSCWFGVQWE